MQLALLYIAVVYYLFGMLYTTLMQCIVTVMSLIDNN